MKKRWLVLVGVLTGVGVALLSSCAQVPEVPGTVAGLSWPEAIWRGAQKDFFIGYTVALVLSIIALVLGARRLPVRRFRSAIQAASAVYLGFYLALPLPALGGISRTLVSLNTVKTNMVHYLVLGLLAIAGLVVGRVFCGWVCPMGVIQRLLFRKDVSVRVPDRVHNYLKYFGYLLLAVMVLTLVVWRETFSAFWAPWDPFRNFFRVETALWATVIMVATLAASVFVFAPWCRYVCPLGALLSVFSPAAAYKVRVDESKCNGCMRCSKTDCDYGAIYDNGDRKPRINYLECTVCGDCIAKCPEMALSLTLKKKSTPEVSVEEQPQSGTT